MNTGIQVTSEVGILKAVLLHRPGRELESLTPEYLDSMLFEDIPFLLQMQEEHDLFANLLVSQGCTVYYVESLLEEVFADAQLRKTAGDQLIESSRLLSPSLKAIIEEFLLQASPEQLVD